MARNGSQTTTIGGDWWNEKEWLNCGIAQQANIPFGDAAENVPPEVVIKK